MTTLPCIRLNGDLEIRRQPIGDGDFCVIVDEFLADPEALVDFACENTGRSFVPQAGYPGLNLILDQRLLGEFHRFILRRMGREFSFLRGNATLDTGLTMVTLRPEELSAFQRLCHTDPRDVRGRRKYAALVYLFSDERLGGTAFYRWKQPDVVYRALELHLRDPQAAAALLAQHSATFRGPPNYMTGSNELAELLAVVPPRFNRLVFYSGEIPHSGHITAPELLTTDFRRGRLTLNCFASVVPM